MNHEEWTDLQERADVTVDGHDLEVAYRELGDPSNPPVVFLHGIPTWSFLWRDVADAVAEDHHVVVPDLLGYGNSSKRDGFDRSIRAQEAMLRELADALDLRRPLTIVAHDIGGGVALRYASHEPDAVDRLVLSNVVCYDSWPVEFISNLGLPSTAEADRAEIESKLDFAFGEGLHGDADDHREFVDGMKAPWLSEDGQVSLARCAVATNTNHTMELEYGAITADVTCLWGADDVLQPLSYAERLVEDVTGDGEIVELDDAYHWVVEDRTDRYYTELKQCLS
ncbi:alpha/beta fold hydrolase [Halomicrococcus sp. SG-WS-1]|uniref:alpha/beta fold hydrolase n=1 Tax=Halomicrococcus sp. SG-WS-1 TaxID=3439057 RepID=UPI003F79F4F7